MENTNVKNENVKNESVNNVNNSTNVDVDKAVRELEKKLKVNSDKDLAGFMVGRSFRVIGREVVPMTDRNGNETGSYGHLKLSDNKGMKYLDITGSPYLVELFIPFEVYDFGFDVEEHISTITCVGSSGTYNRTVTSTKFKIASYCEHKK